jgi:IS30 family transposase
VERSITESDSWGPLSLLRQYYPNGTSMAHITQYNLDAIAAQLNSRPRKSPGNDTPADGLALLFR